MRSIQIWNVVNCAWQFSEKENIPKENILCGNGASEIFKLVTNAIMPKKALVTAPAFLDTDMLCMGLMQR